jgi:hypothetical protein
MELFIFWLIFAAVVGVIASSRGRSGFGWFLISVLISPLLGVLLVALLPSLKPAPGAPTPETHVKCPDCAELVLKEARVCKHCGCRLTPYTEIEAKEAVARDAEAAAAVRDARAAMAERSRAQE